MAEGTSKTPIYDSVVADVGQPVLKMPETPAFAVHGYKARRRLVAATNRVLTDAGFAPMRKEKA